jgi:putative membrane protein
VKIEAFILSTALVVPIALNGQSSNREFNNRVMNDTSQLSIQDRMFLHAIASEDQSEIELAKLALQKSQNPQVQQYAKSKILAADPSMEKGAEQIALQNKTTVSSAPNPAAKQTYRELSNFSGKEFDQRYIRYEARQQGKDLKVVQYESNSAANPQVRSYAQKETTPVKQAADSALKLAQSMHLGLTA